MKTDHFTAERREIRKEWNKVGGGICWHDFLYLFSGRAENGEGVVYAL